MSGEEIIVPRKHWSLTKDAFPTVFQNLPTYLSSALPVARQNPETRREQMASVYEEKNLDWLKLDEILNIHK